ncbi:PepSY-associated TM helix domain-containing protein [Solimonas sp. K1W22B-7]|uniref:PepSY-associated TM helix domain-containing protein n=1 Tax=Solimonas sp. K1W22B-7 TaxID=2303331 RepID=UPI0013C44265|nr:PepSY-associated TM helix domain-containing protein [Solimonas sp. K1W22B-7]
MIKLSQERNKSLLAAHGWSAVFLGLLLYAVILTGVASVFAEELGDWSSPLAEEVKDPFPAGTDRMLRELAGSIDPQYHEEMFVFPRAGDRLYAFFHKHEMDEDGKPRERGVAAEFNPITQTLIEKREGTDEEVDAGDRANALGDFMVELHVRLHLPNPWGLLLTGMLGLAMLVAAITGFVVHRHLIKELFTLRRHKDKLLAARDTHVIAGTWNLPFAFILAFTGSYFSFGSAFGIPAVAMVVFGGDQDKMIETVVGNPPKEDKTPAAMGDLDRMIADVRGRSDAKLNFITVQHWGRADALVTMFMQYPEGKLIGPTYVYGGATGKFRYAKPSLGLQPSTGGALFELMGPLHFGNFAGVFSKAAWFALGFAGAYVTLTGLTLWTLRRREERGWQQLARATVWVGYGLPLALVAAAYGYFPLRAAGEMVHGPMMAAFLLVAALSAAAAWGIRSLTQARRILLGATGAALLLLPALRLLTGGVGWPQAFGAGLHTVLALDIAFALGGALCIASALRRPLAPVISSTPDELDEAVEA